MPTVALTVESDGSFGPACELTTCSELRKHAAYPAAKSCSGLLPARLPPNSFVLASWTSKEPSVVAARPSRPPDAIALVAWRILIDMTFLPSFDAAQPEREVPEFRPNPSD